MRVTNGIPLGRPLFLPVGTVNCVQTLKGKVSALREAAVKPSEQLALVETQKCVGLTEHILFVQMQQRRVLADFSAEYASFRTQLNRTSASNSGSNSSNSTTTDADVRVGTAAMGVGGEVNGIRMLAVQTITPFLASTLKFIVDGASLSLCTMDSAACRSAPWILLREG
jgi:hypothetical protein